MKPTGVRARGATTLLAAFVASLLAFVLASAPLSAPSAAHLGGKPIPLVSDFTITPAANASNASVTVVDLDGGGDSDAVDVQLSGPHLTKPTPMIEPGLGTYGPALSKA